MALYLDTPLLNIYILYPRPTYCNEKQKSYNSCEYSMINAFDTVNHQIIMKKLKEIGIKGTLLKRLRNYLTKRKQYTVANDIVSEYRNITFDIYKCLRHLNSNIRLLCVASTNIYRTAMKTKFCSHRVQC